MILTNQPVICLNCGQANQGKFCSNCGQKADTHRLAFHDIWHDAQHSFLHLDKGVFYNFRTIWQPRLILDYIKGSRVTFFNPILYVLIIAGLLAYLEQTFLHIQISDTSQRSPDFSYQVGFQIGNWLAHYAKYMKLVIVLPLALFSTLIYRNSHQFRLAENFYIAAFISANAAIITILSLPLTHNLDNLLLGRFVSFVMVLLFTWLVYKKGNALTSFIKAFTVVALSYFLTMLFFLLLAFVVIKIKS